LLLAHHTRGFTGRRTHVELRLAKLA
jgi:hypothetical protein